jgi:hypothetical protein
MKHEQNKVKVAPHNGQSYLVSIVLIFSFLAWIVYSSRPTPSSATSPASAAQSQETASPTSATAEIQSSITLLIGNYRAILLFERAADLIIKFIEQIQAGEIALGDSSVRYPYTYAFPVAMEAYNLTPPPAGLDQEWKSVTTVAIEYNKVYNVLLQGKTVSTKDLFTLKAFRQILTNYQKMVELNLAYSGKGPDFLATEQQTVDQLLQEKYGDLLVPTHVP